eukprot:919464_1
MGANHFRKLFTSDEQYRLTIPYGIAAINTFMQHSEDVALDKYFYHDHHPTIVMDEIDESTGNEDWQCFWQRDEPRQIQPQYLMPTGDGVDMDALSRKLDSLLGASAFRDGVVFDEDGGMDDVVVNDDDDDVENDDDFEMDGMPHSANAMGYSTTQGNVGRLSNNHNVNVIDGSVEQERMIVDDSKDGGF